VRDPYVVLGVDRRATDSEIKAAFRRLAAQHHPDKNPDDPQADGRFKELNFAYQLLSDPDKRAAFDRYGAAAFGAPGGGGRWGAGLVDLGAFEGVLGDLLEAFGMRATDRGHLRRRLKLSFAEAALGCKKELEYERVDLCERCHGKGGEPGSAEQSCPVCRGRGRQAAPSGLFFWSGERSCTHCRGTGRVPAIPCSTCKGDGLAGRSHRITVDIPVGIESGASCVVEHAGHRVRPDRAAGNLEVVVEVVPHAYFRRVGDDVHSSLSISFTQATLGGEIEVSTLDGTTRVRVPPATQPGSLLRLRGKGIPHRLRAGRGDHLVEVTIEIPVRLSPRAQELIEQLGHELGEEVHPQERSLFDRLKSWLE
jgi:molecular chaperone DnaJ